ncbi:type VI secretion system contractile sheath small subunit [Azohydromonas caseinilytica]|uniref:Type VI secretion system contractile sheath small subunit n=1 Tax=Azohydromonas caseinilytica TaxID=2728836 RepID=A0A848FHT0_9BURK|nr:type VI secretion system contractile sheath small subunit [Azohydromonas caseinilytica]NML19038.1 type VI secretion system contractile sheath small subunit [Azohydromonas caseinilytica]
MTRKDSAQKRLEKVRPPRVQLTYDVQVGDAIEKKELPFVVGVLGDFSGMSGSVTPPSKLKDRKFVHVDLDNFDDVMAGMQPGASFSVKNRLTPEAGEFAVDLCFNAMRDFRPEAVAEQIEPLRRLIEARTRLSDLRNKLAGNHRLDDLLSEMLSNTENLLRLSDETSKPKE